MNSIRLRRQVWIAVSMKSLELRRHAEKRRMFPIRMKCRPGRSILVKSQEVCTSMSCTSQANGSVMTLSSGNPVGRHTPLR